MPTHTLAYMVSVTIPDDTTEELKAKIDAALVEELKGAVVNVIEDTVIEDDYETEVKSLATPF